MAYIKQLPDKYYETIDLNSPIERQVKRIDRLSRRLTVFVSSSSYDRKISRKFKNALKRYGYCLLDDENIEETPKQIEIAADRGFVLFVLTLNSAKSLWCRREIEIALEKAPSGGSVILLHMEPINEIVENLPSDFLLKLQLLECDWIDFTQGEFKTNVS